MKINNPYWDAVSGYAIPSDMPFESGMKIGSIKDLGLTHDLFVMRELCCAKYAWTITDPDSVAFIADAAKGGIVDPMAGTGYWGYLLTQLDVEVVAYDAHPGDNHWHGGNELYMPVEKMDCVKSVALHPDRTLLLAWPPMDSAGARALGAYEGSRVIYIGEFGGCTGSDKLFKNLDKHWTEISSHTPVQWWGLHDEITVFERN